MPIDDSKWKQAIERESTATDVLEYLNDNRSDAYTTNELVAELVPEETDDESVVAYYRAILEALAHEESVEKREVSVDAEEEDLIPYFRAADEQPDESEAAEQSALPEREVTLDGPIEARMAAENDSIPVHIEDPIPVRIEERPQPDDPTTPFFVRWYRGIESKGSNADGLLLVCGFASN